MQMLVLLYPEFPLPPLLGSRLDEKSMTCSGREQLPAFWTGSSSSHLLPAIARILTGAFTQQGMISTIINIQMLEVSKNSPAEMVSKK